MPTNGDGKTSPREREPRKRISPGQERLLDEYLDSKGPRKCALESPDCSGDLTHDHIDGNKNNNSLFNFRWLCRGHQNKERSRLAVVGRASESAKKNEKERTGVAGEMTGESSEEVRTSMEFRPRFQAWVSEKILHAKKPVTSASLIRGGAQYIRNISGGRKGSKVTTKRWLDELTDPEEGVFETYELKEYGQCVRFRWDERMNGPPPWEIVSTRTS